MTESPLTIAETGSYGGLIMDEAMATVRYIKARKRGQIATCWRFMHAKPNRLLALHAGQSVRKIGEAGSLSAWDFIELDTVLEQKLRHEVVEHLYGSTPRRMDENCYWFTDRIIGLCWEAARQKDEPIPETSINNQLEFIRSELSL